MFNGCQFSPVNFPSESSPLPSPSIELILFGYVPGSNQRLYALCHYKPYVCSNHFLPVLILQFCCYHCFFVVVFLPELILQLCCYYCFSLAILITSSHIVLISMLGQLKRFLWPSICADSLNLRDFQWCSLSMIST